MVRRSIEIQDNGYYQRQAPLLLRENLRALGLSGLGIDILYVDAAVPGDIQECVHVEGLNLDLVWDDIVFGRVNVFKSQSALSIEAHASVTQISKQKAWSVSDLTILPDQNKARKDCFQFESRTFRHLWPANYLEAFRLNQRKQLLFQFRGNHSYILTPQTAAYDAVLNQILTEKLDSGSQKQFTAFDDTWYVDTPPPTYFLKSLEYRKSTLTNLAEWSITMDIRQGKSQPTKKPPKPPPDLAF